MHTKTTTMEELKGGRQVMRYDNSKAATGTRVEEGTREVTSTAEGLLPIPLARLITQADRGDWRSRQAGNPRCIIDQSLAAIPGLQATEL